MPQTTEKQLHLAKGAIFLVLNAIADDPRKYYLMGAYTGSYEKLTEAAAAIWDKPVDEIKKRFQPQADVAERFEQEKEETDAIIEFCQEHGITSENIEERLK
jgi:vacuolar-type H+-ATPase catalytic subunit A/Vma1